MSSPDDKAIQEMIKMILGAPKPPASAELPPKTYRYSVKIEGTQKCYTPGVHVYADDGPTAVRECIDLVESMRDALEAKGYAVAPLEIEKDKEIHTPRRPTRGVGD